MKRKLRVAPGLSLDADYIGGGTLALLAKKGAGKSYTARVLAEEMWAARIPFVLIDPMGTSWGLRAGADGTPDGGLPVPIFGGDHADAPLERTGGTLMADLVVEEGLSMVIDVSSLGTRSAERQFAHDFFDRLYRRNRELVHLLVDEADLFAPQRPQPGDAPLLGVTENIVRRGRNRGIGITLITQRPAVLNKDVLTQVDGLVAMRITGPQDRSAIDEWVKGHGDTEAAAEVKGTLAGLANGECWWWIPELQILERVTVRRSKTFDSSPTKRAGESRREPKSLADVDLGAIEEKMSATRERARADDPRELRRRIGELERQLRDRPATEPETRVETVTERIEVEVPVLDGAVEPLVAASAELREVAKRIDDAAHAIATALDRWSQPSELAASVARRRPVIEREPVVATASPPPVRRQPAPGTTDGQATGLGKGELKVLGVLAEYPEGRTHNELAFSAGYSAKASTIGVILSGLRKMGLVEPGQPIRATAAGLDAVGGARERPTGQALLEHWLRHPRMGAGERKVLLALIDFYPEAPSHEELCEVTGYSPIASTVGVILSNLRKLGIVEKGQRRVATELMEAIGR